jgi:myo-inositol-1(or 4)-monophosphatase
MLRSGMNRIEQRITALGRGAQKGGTPPSPPPGAASRNGEKNIVSFPYFAYNTHSMIYVLHGICKTLLEEVDGGRHRREALGRGAGGDTTHPVDRLAEGIIIQGLRASGRPMTVVSEEAGEVALNGGGGMLALVDPIDGSNNAVTGVPVYAASIALASEGRTLGDVDMACVVNLVNGDVFTSIRGQGAFLGGERITTQSDDVLRAVSYETRAPARDIPLALPVLRMASRTRCLGAVALELAYLAEGAFSAFVAPSPSRSFDFAAGWLIAREAGGVVTGLKGEDLSGVELALNARSTLAASANQAIHRKVIEALS